MRDVGTFSIIMIPVIIIIAMDHTGEFLLRRDSGKYFLILE